MNDTYYIWLSGFVFLISLSCFSKDKLKSTTLIVLAIYATVFVGNSVYSSTKARSKGNVAYMKADRAELSLKLTSGFVAIESYMPIRDASSSKEMVEKYYQEADTALQEAIEAAPQSSILRSRKVILDLDRGKSVTKDLAALKKIDSEKAKKLYTLLSAINKKQKVSGEKLKELEEIAGHTVPAGWYREIVTLQLHKAVGSKKEYEKRHADFIEHYGYFMLKLGGIFIGAAIAGLLGLIVIFAQLFFLKRQPTPEGERNLIAAPAGWDWKVVFAVFMSWLSIEFLLGPPLKGISSNLGNVATEQGATTVALLTAGLYLLQNLPAIALIWFLALKPNKLPFLETMKIRMKVGKLGPFRMFGAGILTWFAAVPIMLILVVLLNKAGLQGSDNPIVAIVLSAAKDATPLGVVLFIFTLGVLPAFVEEILFRGFLYTSLRKKWSVLPALIISAALFSAAHLDMGGAAQLFGLGFLFAFVFEKTKSLVPSMVCHCMWNSAMFLMALNLFG
ncbi:MAG: CPBP family intramembrane metalloprotease [Candidatus Obscuribacterales bacterium]|nr:CPBP family intramembrane metalloprotease [Candidatus Obscuribacterales bacterium]